MELVIPNKKYYISYLEAIDEYKSNGIEEYSFYFTSENDIFKQYEYSRLGKNLPPNYVAGTYLWLVDANEFIGEICIRHTLTEELLHFGGHISYGVRYSAWNRGFGTSMLSKALVYAKETLGLERVLITCNEKNVASASIIEKNGGKLQDTIVNVINNVARNTKRYWIIIN